mgnify:CR=1 FL=1
MIVRNDCVQEVAGNSTLNFEVAGTCYDVQNIGGGFSTEVLNILYDITKRQEKCCSNTQKYLMEINKQLSTQDKVLEYLVKCCKGNPTTKPYELIPGQAVIDITPTKPIPYTSSKLPSVLNKSYTPQVVDNKSSKMVLYPSKKGYMSIIGIPGNWIVKGEQIVDESGMDLKYSLPIFFNHIINEKKSYNNISSNSTSYTNNIELVGIMGYVLKYTSRDNRTPLLIYKTKDLNTGTVKTFEGSISLWNKYSG